MILASPCDAMVGKNRNEGAASVDSSFRLTRTCSLAIGGLAAIVALGWVLRAPEVTRWHPDWPATSPPTALCFGLTAVVLWSQTLSSEIERTRARFIAVVITLVAVERILLLIIGDSIGDAWAWTASITASMAPATAICFVLLSVALLTPPRRSPQLPQAMSLLVVLIGGVGVAQYAYGSNLQGYAQMALPTAIGMIVAAIGTLTVRSDAPLLVLLRDRGGGGLLARRLIPMGVASPVISAWVLLVTPFDVTDDLAILAPLNSVVFAALVWWSAQVVRRGEQVRIAAERQFRQVFEAASSGLLLVNPGGQINLANPAIARMFGYSMDELSGMSTDRLLPDLAASAATARDLGSDPHGTHQNGSLLPIEISQTPITTSDGIMTITSITDLSTRRAAEAMRAQAHERYLMLTRATKDPVRDWTRADEHLWWNGNLTKAFGWDVPEHATLDWWMERIHPDDRSATTTSFRAAMGTEGELWIAEYRFECRDHSYRHVLDRSAILRDRLGEAIRVVSAMLDITDRIASERVLHERSVELERSNSELERFAQIASHDLQEPLRTVSGFVQLLAKRYGDRFDANGLRYLKYAVDGADRMRTLIDALLTYARIDRRDAVITTEIALSRVMARVRADLRTAIVESHTELSGDRQRGPGHPGATQSDRQRDQVSPRGAAAGSYRRVPRRQVVPDLGARQWHWH
jgi:PAS domain S-box-containing protein